MSVDPLFKSYAMLTPYQFASNSPIAFIDLDGLEAAIPEIGLEARDGISYGAGINQVIMDYEVQQHSNLVEIHGAYLPIVTVTPTPQISTGSFWGDLILGESPAGIYVDGANAIGALSNGDIGGFVENGFSALPLSGAFIKFGKYSKYGDELGDIMDTKLPDEVLAPNATKAAKNDIDIENNIPVTNKIYERPNNATTSAQRKHVQGKKFATCGNPPDPKKPNVADHKTPLVKEHYQTGSIDKTKMRSLDAVQPQCQGCSNKQGAEMSKYSKDMKKVIENNKGG